LSDFIEAQVIYTERITNEELRAAVKGITAKAMKLFDIILNLNDCGNAPVITKQLKQARNIARKIDAGEVDLVEDAFWDVENDEEIRRLLRRIEQIQQHGQGLTAYDIIRLGLVHDFLEDLQDGSEFVELLQNIANAIHIVEDH
jgi:hypothetical protein